MRGELPSGWPAHAAAMVERLAAKSESVATRKASQNVIDAIAAALPELVGGSADLTGSNLTAWSASRPAHESGNGNYLHYGVREFGMSAIMNGLALHGGFLPFGGTFLVFSDYARNALRMAALMKLRAIHVLTHDSIGLGEDGPTHQPIEHAAALRCIPNMDVWRPCDAVETAVAWSAAVERRDGPSCLLLSRQNLPAQPRGADAVASVRRGGYVLRDATDGRPEVVIIGTGSEVQLAVSAQAQLGQQGIAARVVSMPCTAAFDRQDAQYRASILPAGIPRVSVEAGITGFWRQYVGLEGETVGIDRFGESAPAPALYDYFGLTADSVVRAAIRAISRQAGSSRPAQRQLAAASA
jgi:transketolase